MRCKAKNMLAALALGVAVGVSPARAEPTALADAPTVATAAQSGHERPFHALGGRAAVAHATGSLKRHPLSIGEVVLVGVVILMNNNSNDGVPATYTGANGSNFAAGG